MGDYYEENEIDSQLCPFLSKGVVYPDNWVGTSMRVKYAFIKIPCQGEDCIAWQINKCELMPTVKFEE
jgi:hypothetical protein